MPPRKSTIRPQVRKYNYKVVDVKPDGNCFFRAIYKSAKHSGNLENLVKCFLDKSLSTYVNSERVFITDLREKLAKSIEDNQDGGVIEGMFGYLNGFVTADKKEDLMASYKEVINSLPAWMSIEFSSPPKDLAKFREAFCKNIRKQGTFVSQIEIDIFKYLNDTFCNTPEKHTILNMFMSPPTRAIDTSQINIVNVANIHYKYLRSYESVDFESKSKSSSSFSASPMSSTSASTTLSSIRSNDSSDAKMAKTLQKLVKKGNVSSDDADFEFLASSTSPTESSSTTSAVSSSPTGTDSSLSPDTKEVMTSFARFVTRGKKLVPTGSPPPVLSLLPSPPKQRKTRSQTKK
jgi:hypothetical protein